jgi:Bacterial type II and III secretion system protein/Bacterial type II/III secretion system short domain
MKRIFLTLTFVGMFTASPAGIAQTASPAGEATPATPAVAPASAAAPADAPPATAAPASDAAPAAAAAPTAPAAAEATNNTAQPPAMAANPPAEAPVPTGAPQAGAAQPAAPAAPAQDPAAAPAANAPAQSGTIIPLIVMDDVPLTDAIRNLARQANINYMLDPKVVFGQVGQDGKATAQPAVSIRWENISAEQALNALLANYSLQLIEDAKSKIARVTIKDPAAPPPVFTKIIQLKFAGPSNVIASVQGLLLDKRSRVLPDVRTSQLVVVGTEKELADVDELIQRLDTQTRQVLIETRLVEVTSNPTTKKGVDWTGTLSSQHVSFGNGIMTGTSTTTIPGNTVTVLNSVLGGGGLAVNTSSGVTPNIGFLNADGVNAAISFLNTYAESKVLSCPRTVTLDNEEAHIEVGTMFPIVNTTAGTANTTGGSQVTYSNLTVALKVTPRISANDFVNLKVSPNVTRLGPLVTSVVGGVNNSVYEFLTRQVDTRVLIPSGNTLVMGGLMQDEVNINNTKVPLLGDIPVLGYLFRLDSKDRIKQNLLIFITPTIVQDTDFQPTKTTFLSTPLPAKDSMDEDWSAWDSGQPKDWKKAMAPEQPVFDEKLAHSALATPTGIQANQ